MGISDSKQALLFEAIEDGVFWFECPTRDANLLRPNFMGSWSDNAGWRDGMIHYVREKALLDSYGRYLRTRKKL